MILLIDILNARGKCTCKFLEREETQKAMLFVSKCPNGKSG